MYPIRVFLVAVATAWPTFAVAQLPGIENVADSTTDQAAASAPSRTWADGLQAGTRQAQARQRPLLVFAGSETCPWCRRLRAEFESEPLSDELGAWTLAYVDVDRHPADARDLGVGAVPALRILNVRGIRIASLEGLKPPEEVVGWLRQHYAEATKGADQALLDSGVLTVLEVIRLVRQLDQRDPVQREAAIQRLTANRDNAAAPVIKAFREGKLATRLAALEILQQWQAPIDGLDPWRPETITPERVALLIAWRDSPPAAPPSEPPETLTDDDLDQAREQIDRLLKTNGVMAAAIRGRLARFGPALLPEVYERLKNTENDEQRERLLALRYRLVASDSLIVRWPAGIVRLASADVDERRRAAEQLAELASQEDQALLLELFSDSDSLVRELSLKSLDHLGGAEARASLARLLNDPEPNVRAAVLKRLAEDAPAAMVTQVAEYVKQERDPDLLVHAIRYFKATPQAKSVEALLPLLMHGSWQVRAEAAEAVGAAVGSLDDFVPGPTGQTGLQADVFAALIKLLEDDDAFVVSRAVNGLRSVDMEIAVEPLANAAMTHPDLAPQITAILSRGEKKRAKALPHMQKFRNHEVPEVRAAALKGMAQMTPDTMAEWLPPSLDDESKTVRLAAIDVMFEALGDVREEERQRIVERQAAKYNRLTVDPFYVPAGDPFGGSPVVVRESLLQRTVRSLFGGFAKKEDEPAETVAEPEPKIDVDLDVPDLVEELPELPPNDAVPAEEAPPFESSHDAPAPLPRRAGDLGPPITIVPGGVPGPAVAPADSDVAEDAEDADDAGDEKEEKDNLGLFWDEWLAKFHAGDKRAKWIDEVVEPLTGLLDADDPDERMAAARVLVAVGQRERALPVVNKAVEADPGLAVTAAAVLPWLPWAEREVLFDQLMAKSRSNDDRSWIVRSMALVQDPRAANKLWTQLRSADLDLDMAQSLDRALAAVYFGDSYFGARTKNEKTRSEIRAAAEPLTREGSDLQRLVALITMVQAEAEQAAPVARRLADDQTIGPELRRDAFQVLLAVSSASQRRELAAAAMAGDDTARQLVAIRYYVEGDDGLRYLRGYVFHVNVESSSGNVRRSGEPIIPAVPKGIKKEHVLPLLEHEKLEIRAFAAYLLALMDDPQGMPLLIEYWRQQPDLDSRMKLVYRAIAVLDDPNYVPILREIYKRLDRYDMNEFYWTIRIMSGPEILSLRKQMREEVDPDYLR